MAHPDWAMLYNIKCSMLHKWNPSFAMLIRYAKLSYDYCKTEF